MGSEMCIRDSPCSIGPRQVGRASENNPKKGAVKEFWEQKYSAMNSRPRAPQGRGTRTTTTQNEKKEAEKMLRSGEYPKTSTVNWFRNPQYLGMNSDPRAMQGLDTRATMMGYS